MWIMRDNLRFQLVFNWPNKNPRSVLCDRSVHSYLVLHMLQMHGKCECHMALDPHYTPPFLEHMGENI